MYFTFTLRYRGEIILFSHMYVTLVHGLFASDFMTKILYPFFTLAHLLPPLSNSFYLI
jgi:hypothetical protein